jgi:hypothetical protein
MIKFVKVYLPWKLAKTTRKNVKNLKFILIEITDKYWPIQMKNLFIYKNFGVLNERNKF